MNDRIGLAERLLGLDGFRVLEVTEGPDALVIAIETTAGLVGCSECAVRAEAHDRMPIAIGTWPATDGRPGWCGSSGGRGAESRCARRGPGPSSPPT
jgi:hypothetical protein